MKRVQWLDIAKFFFILIVIYSHLESAVDEFSCLIVPIMLPGFLFASGYAHRSGQDFKSFFIKKFRTLFVPWLILSVFDISLSQIASFGEHNYLYELGWNFLQIRGRNDQLWFVAALFTAYIPFYFYIEWYKRKSSNGNYRTAVFFLIALAFFGCGIAYSLFMDPALLPWGSISLPWHLDYSFRAVFFMACGYFFREKVENWFDAFPSAVRTVFLLSLHAVIVYAPYFITIHDNIFALLANLITPLLGIFSVVSISKALPANRYFLYVGQNTRLYFAFHGKVYGVIEGILRQFFAAPYYALLSNKISAVLFAVALTILVSFILIIPCYIVNRWFPFILGKKKPDRVQV